MSRHTVRVRAGDDRASLYTEITDKIIAELEAGRIPWVQPWGTAAIKAPLAMPRNASMQRGYSGINVLILWGAVIEHGFSGQSWLTFRQALGLGGHVRKRERGTTVVYADRFTRTMNVCAPRKPVRLLSPSFSLSFWVGFCTLVNATGAA
jgi:antirestriction protein ArdC